VLTELARIYGAPLNGVKSKQVANRAISLAASTRASSNCPLSARGANPLETVFLFAGCEEIASGRMKPMKLKPTSPIIGLGGEGSYRLLVDSIKDYAIFMLDTAGNVATWNAGAERIFRHSILPRTCGAGCRK
jgi:hypothetical protein